MNTADLRSLDDKGLLLRRQDLVGEFTSLKFRHATGQLENTSTLRAVRRALGRVNTIIRERELEQDLSRGSLAAQVGRLESGSIADAFRKFMGQSAE